MTIALLGLALAFRLFYGLSMPFWYEDERQIYLIGLRSFARGEWPYLGADVVWTGGQLPGALMGLLIRWPLTVWPAPEAPFVLLNVLSFAALAFFAWYLCRRYPDVPRWLIWSALLTLPWTLNFSTHINNVSYVLAGGVAFFVGFFEGWPALRRRILPFWVAWSLMGAGLVFVMQMHMSWVLLPPYLLVAIAGVVFGQPDQIESSRRSAVLGALAGLVVGIAISGSVLGPTIQRDGLFAGNFFAAISFQAQSPVGLVTTAARVMSLASFETNRFLGFSTADRILVLWRHLWMVPFVLIIGIAGVVQPLWMAFTAFRRDAREPADWAGVRKLAAATVLLIYASFFLSVRGPQAHAFYVTFPIAALFACSCWRVSTQAAPQNRRRWERVAGIVIASGLLVHTGLAIDRWPRLSLYADRPLVAAAITQRNDRFLGDRRDTTKELVDHRPRPIDGVADADAYLAERPEDMLHVVDSEWSREVRGVSRFRLAIANRGRLAAWVDIRYQTTYFGADGQSIESHEGVIKRIVQPGGTLTGLDISDDFAPSSAVRATIVITGAERVIPSRRPAY
jgi:hypothetical protein